MFLPPIIVPMWWSVQAQEARKGTESRHGCPVCQIRRCCRRLCVSRRSSVLLYVAAMWKQRRAEGRGDVQRKNGGAKVDKDKAGVVKTRNRRSCTLSELSRSTSGRVASKQERLLGSDFPWSSRREGKRGDDERGREGLVESKLKLPRQSLSEQGRERSTDNSTDNMADDVELTKFLWCVSR